MNNDMMEAYLYEMNTQLEQLEEIVLAAENAGSFSQEDVNEIFRIMHTVKGSSAMMEFNSLMTVSHNIEDLFLDLAKRSGIDDIRTFAHIFEISKRTGGNLMQIMRQSSNIITEKIETKQEMDTVLAEKKMEQKVMAVAPLALMVLLTQSTGDFMEPLFNTFGGRVVCTIALALVIVGFLWGNKLTDIEI